MTNLVLWLGEIGFLIILTGLAILAPAPRPLVWGVFLIAWLAPLVPLIIRPNKSHPKTSSVPLLLALAFLGLGGAVRWSHAFQGWWSILPAGILLLAGLLGALDDWRQGTSWSNIRRELTLTGIILLIFGTISVVATSLLTKYYSDMKIPLGDPGFLFTCLVVCGTWFGLDATVRRGPHSKLTTIGLLWNRRHTLLIGLAAVVILVRTNWL